MHLYATWSPYTSKTLKTTINPSATGTVCSQKTKSLTAEMLEVWDLGIAEIGSRIVKRRVKLDKRIKNEAKQTL